MNASVSTAARFLLGAAVATIAGLSAATPALAIPDDDGPDLPPLVQVPPGCDSPEPADVTFVGTAVAKDFEKVRYEIGQVRAGSTSTWSVNGLVDVLYLEDSKFLDVGEEYLVGARFEPVYGLLRSTIRPAEPLFGGNAVIGLDDTDVECPTLDDPVRTVNLDGTSVDSGVLSPLFEDKARLAATIGVPAAIAFGVLVGLVILRQLVGLGFRGVFALGRAAVTPTADHRAIRTRRHRGGFD